MKKQFYHSDYASNKLQDSILGILDAVPLWSMATINIDGTCHSNTAYFSFDEDFNFYFLTPPSTKHSANLSKNSSMAVTVFNTNQPWGENPLQGLQIFGIAMITDASNEIIAHNTYGKRFPNYLEWTNTLSEEERSKLESKFYCFKPTRLKLIDEQIFGEEKFISLDL